MTAHGLGPGQLSDPTDPRLGTIHAVVPPVRWRGRHIIAVQTFPPVPALGHGWRAGVRVANPGEADLLILEVPDCVADLAAAAIAHGRDGAPLPVTGQGALW